MGYKQNNFIAPLKIIPHMLIWDQGIIYNFSDPTGPNSV